MCVRPKFVALLPNAVVVFAPVFANMFADAVQHSMHVAVQFFGFTKEMRHGFDKLAINIQLHLFACGVAHAHRQRPAVSLQMRQDILPRRRFAKNIIRYAQLWTGQARGVQQPVYERCGIVLIAETEQCMDGERRIAQPGEAIIPN